MMKYRCPMYIFIGNEKAHWTYGPKNTFLNTHSYNFAQKYELYRYVLLFKKKLLNNIRYLS